MRPTLLLMVSSLLVLEVLPADGQAQLIDVGRGYVRAPFVRLQRRGRLRDRFQAPLVDAKESGTVYQPPPRALQPPPVPPATPLQRVDVPVTTPNRPQPKSDTPDWAELRRSVIAGEAELHQQLTTTPSGPSYRSHLHVGRLRELLKQNTTTAPAGETRRQLQEILGAYNQTLIDPYQRSIARLSGFETVQAGLMQLLAPVDGDHPRPEHVHVDRTTSLAPPPRVPSGEPQPTQVLPAVRDSH
jgi:hypothetical protein